MQSETVLMARIEAVRTKNMEELIEQFHDLYGFDCGETSIHHLRRRIIYRLQELFYGGVNDADMEILNAIADKDKLANLKHKKRKVPVDLIGTKLYRIWKGRQYEVTVREDSKFRFNGRIYKSLSAIAREITGSRWNGKLFFGVKQ